MPNAQQAATALNALAESRGWQMRCDAELNFTTPKLDALRDIWREKAAGNPLPSRADFDARTLKPFLGNLAIVERLEAQEGVRYRLRYFGTEFVHFFGEQSNRFVDEFLPRANVERWAAGYEAVFAAGAPLRFLSYFQVPQVSFLNGESFSVPLGNGDRPPNTLLTAMYFLRKNHNRAEAG
ncbi:MAG TPA: PAS domain-containing protein [Rhizomicrobium sp.]|nr:PAS domain-containing protein [Rhizomicrobium sp.]